MIARYEGGKLEASQAVDCLVKVLNSISQVCGVDLWCILGADDALTNIIRILSFFYSSH